ncbi:hypothetical protein EZS27_019122 [termite gut metagenome]|uniref:DUF4836 family protein n=1 Tax=termite gut metagenome TaxID=433724 RepID=A0A5J4RFJ0_9ZZZZ
MKKKTTCRFSLLMISAVFFMVSCSEKSATYTNVIPADAAVVLSFDLKSTMEKAGLNGEENAELKQKLADVFGEEMNAESFALFERIIKDPAESGIDIASPLYVFFQKKTEAIAFVAKIGNKNKLKSLLNVLVSEDIATPTEKRNGYSYVTFSSNAICVFNGTTLLISNNRDNNYAATDVWMSQAEENSIIGSSAFQNMQGKKGEIKLMVSLKGFKNELDKSNAREFEDLTVISNLSFESGKISVQVESYTDNEELKRVLRQQQRIFKQQELTFLGKFPASTIAYLSLGLDGDELCDYMLENAAIYGSFLINAFGMNNLMALESLFRSVEGDLSVGLLDVTLSSVTFAAYAKVKDDSAIKTFYDAANNWGIRGDFKKVEEGRYVYESGGQKIYFGVKNKQLYITNDNTIYKNITENVNGKSLKDAEFVSNIKESSQYLVVSMDNILNMPTVRFLTAMGEGAYGGYISIASCISHLEITGQGNIGEINLCFKDKETNALKQIVGVAKRYSGI